MRSQAIQGGMPRPGKVVITLLGVTVGAYILELVLLRMGVPLLEWLALTPSDVVGRGYVWQLATAALLHSPSAVGHLLMNVLALDLKGSKRIIAVSHLHTSFYIDGKKFSLLQNMQWTQSIVGKPLALFAVHHSF